MVTDSRVMEHVSLEGGLDPPQCVLDSPCLSLTGMLEVGILVRGEEVDV